jgi:hypothetical protein
MMDNLACQVLKLARNRLSMDLDRDRLSTIDNFFKRSLVRTETETQLLADESERSEQKRRQLENVFRQLDRQKQKAALSRLIINHHNENKTKLAQLSQNELV